MSYSALVACMCSNYAESLKLITFIFKVIENGKSALSEKMDISVHAVNQECRFKLVQQLLRSLDLAPSSCVSVILVLCNTIRYVNGHFKCEGIRLPGVYKFNIQN